MNGFMFIHGCDKYDQYTLKRCFTEMDDAERLDMWLIERERAKHRVV